MKILNYNIMSSYFDNSYENQKQFNWKFRKKELINLIKKYNAEIICLQEDNEIQINDIKKELQDYNFINSEKDYFKSSNSFFFKKEISIISNKIFFLKSGKKIFCNVIVIKIKNELFCIINVHLKSPRFFSNIEKGWKMKEKEIEELIFKIYKNKLEKFNLIICGDFNLAPERNAYEIIKKHFYDVSINFQLKFEPTVSKTWPNHKVHKKIDYFFVNDKLINKIKNFKIDKFKFVGIEKKEMSPSVHYPIILELK